MVEQVRRLQRGIKTLEGLMRSAKAGKSIPEDDIPPVVATGQPANAAALPSKPPLSSPPKADVDASVAHERPAPSPKPAASASPAPLIVFDASVPAATSKPNASTGIVSLLEARQHEYRDAALAAKRAGSRENALKYFKLLKVSKLKG